MYNKRRNFCLGIIFVRKQHPRNLNPRKLYWRRLVTAITADYPYPRKFIPTKIYTHKIVWPQKFLFTVCCAQRTDEDSALTSDPIYVQQSLKWHHNPPIVPNRVCKALISDQTLYFPDAHSPDCAQGNLQSPWNEERSHVQLNLMLTLIIDSGLTAYSVYMNCVLSASVTGMAPNF